MIIDGKKEAEILRNEVKKEILLLKEKTSQVPNLSVILIGNYAPSEIYVKNKVKKSEEVGMISKVIRYPNDVSEKEILKKIHELNEASDVSGILVQLPLPKNIHELRGNCGFFFEYEASCIDEISFMINNKYQTLTYFGFEKEFLADFVFKNNLRGIDRIVPIGNALDIGLDWDGFEIVSSLSRIISFS